ncbi:hypothetical protein ABLG96_12650 [Nakamurella sp. A5-74]|uniref:ABC-2 type transport system permease protein n=1 Tax=Nakamurella sp. A5-74 TaxID=3158264 RepID=A0AAU8DK32_9ACTN
MVAIFASLKWRLVTSRVRALSPGKRIRMIIGLCLALLAVGAIAYALSMLRSVPEAGYLAVTGLFALQLVAWTLTPMVAFGVDETVDPSKFALLPIRPATLQRGLLVSSVVGYLPLFNAVILIGCAIGLSFLGWMLPIALLCIVLQLVTCVVFSRAAATSMATLMSSRRGRDLGMAVGFGVLVVYMLATLGLNSGSSAGFGAAAQRTAEILSWTPPGALASLPAQIATEQWARAVASAVIALVFLTLGWLWWSRALRKSLVTVDSDTASSAPSRGIGGASAIGGTLIGTAQVVAGRDRTLMWRDPMRRMPWLISIFMGVAWPLIVVPGEGAVFASAFGALLMGSQAANQFGLDGSGLWLHLVAFGDQVRARGELLGHNLAVLVPAIPLVVAVTAAVAAIRGGWDFFVPAVAMNLAVVVCTAAIATWLSVSVPYAVPQSRKSMFASSIAGQRSASFRSAFGSMLLGLAAALPVIGFGVLGIVIAPVWSWVALVVALVYPPVLLMVLLRRAADQYLSRGSEILAVVMAGDRA